ncbi:MAG: SDR family NAD(P)-dependent oxidoreductase [Oscillospiraceae bacterium]|nr:SDR family NAD(P)-dependent oxidoreductase [Oscillospiraceae bacterium]
MESRVKGKIALVTGATSGIGRSCARELAKLGCNVIVAGRRAGMLAAVKMEVEAQGVKALPLVMDVRSWDDVYKKINNLPTEWSDIEILVANAGLSRGMDKLYEGRIEEMDEMIDTNVKGLIYTIRAVVPQMVQKDLPGIVITTGSVAGNAAYAGGAVYCASKAAARYIADGLRIDTMGTRIRVTNVEPGMVETEFSVVRFRGDKEKADAVYKGIDALTGDDIAETVAYICNLPENVQIPEIIMTPNKQADALNKYVKK